MSSSIDFTLNGQSVSVTCRPDMTVLEWLRGDALLRGTKEGCAEGDCGACSVLVKCKSACGEETKFQAANSCIMLMGQLEGAALMTVEGLAQSAPDGHVVQQRMAENGSSQCGFCTPGIVASLAGLLDQNNTPEDSDIHDALAGNLCRCTGYRPIVEAALSAAQGSNISLPEIKLEAAKTVVGAQGESVFHLPKTLAELLELKTKYTDAVLLAGGTDMSLDVAHARVRWKRVICTRDVQELQGVDIAQETLRIGGGVSWQTALPVLQKYWPSFATLVRRFGSTQIRSMGTLAGNLATASPIGDGAPALIALGASLTLASKSGQREVALEDFFIDYRQCDLAPDEVIEAITIPLPKPQQEFRAYKISKRYDQDISTVCGAFSLTVANDTVSAARIAYGGMAATPVRCRGAEAAITGCAMDEATLSAAKTAIEASFQPMSDMRGSAAYRAMVASKLMERLFADLSGEAVEVMSL
jgi:xanthine dehydrogenase small subunit